jgi:trimeric autotransporter adhesin
MPARAFPVDALSSRRGRRRRRVRRGGVALAVAIVVAAGTGVTVTALSRRPDAGFRTAAVTTEDLESTVSGVATIEPVTQAAVAFPTSGTVATVDATVGAQVTAGEALATLDTTALQAQVHQKQEALDQAQLILTKALAGEDVSALLRSGGGGMSRVVSLLPTIVTPTFTVVSAVGADEIAAAQHAVLAAQHAVDAARSAAAAKLDSATTVCAAVGADVDPSDPAGATSTIQACQAALQDVVSAQGAVSDAQHGLASAATQLDDLLGQYADQLQSSAPTTPTTEPATTPTTEPATTATTTPTTQSPTTPTSEPGATTTTEPGAPTTGSSAPRSGGGRTGSFSGGSGGSGGSGRSSSRSAGASPSFGASGGSGTVSSPSSADLIAYQTAVDSANAQLVAAQQQLAQATIVSPIAGTVVDVGLVAGDAVSAASTTQRVLVQGAGGYEATLSLDLADIVAVKVGQAARLVPDGSTTPVTGHVVAVSGQPDSSSSTTTTYRVTVALDGDTSGLRNGALGTLSIVTVTAKGALAVPSSAVTTVGARHVVRIVDGSTATDTRVQVGVVGATWTQITEGVTAGQQVAVADLAEPLPSAATTTSQTSVRAFQRTLGGGGFVRPGG